MLSKPKIMTVLVVFSLVLVLAMGFLETRMIRSYFLDYSIEQVKYTMEQLVSPLAELDISPEDEDTAELASWIYYNTGLRVLITDSEGAILVDSSEEGSLVGQNIDQKSLTATMQEGEISSFKIPLVGKGEVAVSAPWQTAEAISGAIVLVGPLETYAKQGTDELSPFFKKAGWATLLIAIVGSFILSEQFYKHSEHGVGSPASPLLSQDSSEHVGAPDDTHVEEYCIDVVKDTDEDDSKNEDAQKSDSTYDSPPKQWN